MTGITQSVDSFSAHKSMISLGADHIKLLARIIEHLTERRINDDHSLAEQANLLSVEIKGADDLHKIILLAGIGLDLSSTYKGGDDMLGEKLFFLFGEIAAAAVDQQGGRIAN